MVSRGVCDHPDPSLLLERELDGRGSFLIHFCCPPFSTIKCTVPALARNCQPANKIIFKEISLVPLRRFRARLSSRSGRDLSAVPADDIPAEIAPVAAALNDVLARLKAAFEAERSFASHAAHELRTPLAGAIAQAQRLRSETSDPSAAAHAGEIEATLKRLTRLSERLMQLARAEGGRLRIDSPRDLRPTARLVAEDTARGVTPDRIAMSLPDTPVLSDLDPDAFGILLRNLIENALRHGAAGGQVAVALATDGTLRVANDGPVVPPEVLGRLTARFERGGAGNEGSGLGLAIVAAIAERLGSRLTLHSPATGRDQGFEVEIRLPAENDLAADQDSTRGRVHTEDTPKTSVKGPSS